MPSEAAAKPKQHKRRIESLDHKLTRRANATSRLYRFLAEQFAAVLLKELGSNLTSIVLYGSAARGSARPDSDIDLFVVAGDTEAEKESIWERIWDIELAFWNNPDVLALRNKGYRASIETFVVSKAQANRGTPLYLDMTLDAIVLHDPGGFFIRRIEKVKRRMAALRSYREWLERNLYVWQLKAGVNPGEIFSLPYIEEEQA